MCVTFKMTIVKCIYKPHLEEVGVYATGLLTQHPTVIDM